MKARTLTVLALSVAISYGAAVLWAMEFRSLEPLAGVSIAWAIIAGLVTLVMAMDDAEA